MAKKVTLKDYTGNECYPKTHAKQVLASNGGNIEDEILNKVDLSAIDLDSNTISNIAKAQVPCRYIVTTKYVSVNVNIGVLECFSDSMGHMVTQKLTTHCTLPLDGSHQDDKIFTYYRSYHIQGGTSTIPTGTWGEWTQVYSSDNQKDIDAFKASLQGINTAVSNLNANTGISEYEEFSDQKEYKAGETVKYNGLLKTFIKDHAAGAWDESEVEIANLKKDLEGQESLIKEGIRNILFYYNAILDGNVTEVSEYENDTILKTDGTTENFSGYKLYTIKNDDTGNRYLYIEVTLKTLAVGSFASIGLYRKSDDKCCGVYQYNGKIVLGIHSKYYVKLNSFGEKVRTSYSIIESTQLADTLKEVTSENFICGDIRLSGDISIISDNFEIGLLNRSGNIVNSFTSFKTYTIKNDNSGNKFLYIKADFSASVNVVRSFANLAIFKSENDEFLLSYRINNPNIIRIPAGYYAKISIGSNATNAIETSYSVVSLAESTDYNNIPLLNRPADTTITGTNEEEDGYYRINDGVFVKFNKYKSSKYQVRGGTNYAITSKVSGGATCLAIAVDKDNNVLTYYNKGTNGITQEYVDYIIKLPNNTAYLLCTGSQGVYPIVRETKPDPISKFYVDRNLESCAEFTVIVGTNEEEDGYYEVSTGAFRPASNFKSTKYLVGGDTNYAITSVVSGGATCLAIAVDKDNNVLTYYNKGENEIKKSYTDYVISTPSNTAYLLCTSVNSIYPILKKVLYNPASKEYIKNQISKATFGDELLNYWKGKKGVWFGTSIPAQGYPPIVGNYIGMTITNESMGSSMARAGKKVHTPNDPLGDVYGVTGVAWQNICYSLSLSQEEKHDIFINWTTEQRKANLKLKGYEDNQLTNIKGFSELMGGNFYGEETDESQINTPSSKPTDIMAENYVEFRKKCYSNSWNNSVDIEDGFGEINGRLEKYLSLDKAPDLWVFDHGHNDNLSSDSDEDYTTIPEDEYDRWTFIGAMNFLIKKIFNFNPRARVVIIGHYNNSSNKKRIGDAQKVLADYWNIPIYESWKFLQMPGTRVVTTNAYWDKNGSWHTSGFDGTNGYDGGSSSGVSENPRQLEDGTWVHDITLLNAWMKDSLHPGSLATMEYEARNMASFIRNNVL